MIEKMLNPDVQAGKPFFNDDPLTKYDISILVGVLGDLQGQVICGMSMPTAKNIASQMLMTQVEIIDEMGKSALCELKNIIVGTASTNLSLNGYHCNITPPLFLMTQEIPDFLKHVQTALAIPIQTPFGNIEINLALRKDRL
ncbi:chemotaxis protein CheX [Hydrogenispora ethanolica]|uniref:Chemotaxis protein CheX n=1 Tax=Hydrogenispora ethanolica TaxID=1082276 RepID=A0A4R1R8U9_HYDET|nr:chemotaxis protein CheX [Hydrogenispora ethanolica]TCL62105.1 chemotaxis protein CheX [Hydrogenispora ethanolica]